MKNLFLVFAIIFIANSFADVYYPPDTTYQNGGSFHTNNFYDVYITANGYYCHNQNGVSYVKNVTAVLPNLAMYGNNGFAGPDGTGRQLLILIGANQEASFKQTVVINQFNQYKITGYADKITYDPVLKTLLLSGNAEINVNGQETTADIITYNWQTHQYQI